MQGFASCASIAYHRSLTLCSLYTYSLSVALQALTVISMGGIADRGALLHQTLMSSITQYPKISLLPQAVAIWLCRTRLLFFPLLFPPPIFVTHVAPLRAPCRLREYRIRRIHRRAKCIPPTSCRVFITIFGSRRYREALTRDRSHILTRHRPRLHGWHLVPTIHIIPRPARRRVHRFASIRHRRFWCMVGGIFYTRAPAFAWSEWI